MTDIYRAIADPTRRKILTLLSRHEYTQSELVDQFTISQPAVKKHIAILLEENVVIERKQGRFRVYRLNQEAFSDGYQKLQLEIGSLLEDKLLKLKAYVEGEQDGEDD